MRDNIDNSSVFKDFVKIAESYGWVKEADDPKVIQDKYNTTDESGTELIDKAHPEEAWVAEALGDGGLIENQNEQHDTLISVLYKMPEGSLTGRYAEMVNKLTKTANNAFIRGDVGAYLKIHDSIDTLNKTATPIIGAIGAIASFIGWGLLPFIGKQVGTKVVPHIFGKGLIMGGTTAGLAGLGSKLTSRQENLKTDINDAIEVANDIIGDEDMVNVHAQTRALVANLSQFKSKFADEIPTSKEELTPYLVAIRKLSILTGNGGAITQLVEDIADSEDWYKFGFGKKSRLEEKILDVEKGLSKVKLSLAILAKVGKKAMTGNANLVPKNDVTALLERAGYSTKQGVTSALKAVEREISELYPKATNEIVGKLTVAGKSISVDKLARLLRAAGKIQ